MSDVEAMFGVSDAGAELGERYLAAVRSRNADEVRRLVAENDKVLWGSFTRQLSSEDFKWAFGVLP